MNFIGSKRKLSEFIKTTIYSVVGNDLSDKIFCDIFAGTGSVGKSFKQEVKQIISNDIEYFSFVLNKNYIENNKQMNNQQSLINELKPDYRPFIRLDQVNSIL